MLSLPEKRFQLRRQYTNFISSVTNIPKLLRYFAAMNSQTVVLTFDEINNFSLTFNLQLSSFLRLIAISNLRTRYPKASDVTLFCPPTSTYILLFILRKPSSFKVSLFS